MKCDFCGREFEAEETTDGLPNGVGLVHLDGTVTNVCIDCIMSLGEQLRGDEDELDS